METLHRDGTPGKAFGEKFERDVAPETRIFRLVDHPHASTPQLAQNAIVRHRLAYELVCGPAFGLLTHGIFFGRFGISRISIPEIKEVQLGSVLKVSFAQILKKTGPRTKSLKVFGSGI